MPERDACWFWPLVLLVWFCWVFAIFKFLLLVRKQPSDCEAIIADGSSTPGEKNVGPASRAIQASRTDSAICRRAARVTREFRGGQMGQFVEGESREQSLVDLIRHAVAGRFFDIPRADIALKGQRPVKLTRFGRQDHVRHDDPAALSGVHLELHVRIPGDKGRT